MEDNETNDQLNEIISEFLFALHPYVMMKASLKCLEWLVYRYVRLWLVMNDNNIKLHMKLVQVLLYGFDDFVWL